MKNLWGAAVLSLLMLAGCSDDDTEISGGGGGGGDGGAESAQYAGTYRGEVKVTAESKDFGKASDKSAMTLLVRSNGTVLLTVEGESANGSISGNAFNVPMKIKWTEEGVVCNGNVVASGTVTGSTVSGPVSGNGNCEFIGVKTSVKVTGSLSGRKS